MNHKIITLIILGLFAVNQATAQHSKYPSKTKIESKRYNPATLKKVKPFRKNAVGVPQATPSFSSNYRSLPALQAPQTNHNFTYTNCTKTKLPIYIKGAVNFDNSSRSQEQQCYDFLNAVKQEMQIKNVEQEFVSTKISEDDLGFTHIRMQQMHKGIPVFGSEITLHANRGKVRNLTGRYYPTSTLQDLTPSIDFLAGKDLALADLANHTKVSKLNEEAQKYIGDETAELVIYHPDGKVEIEHLCWHYTIYPNVKERWEYFVDAKTGDIVQFYKNSCSLHCTAHHHTHNHTNAYTHETTEHADCESISIGTKSNEATLVDGPAIANAQDLFNIGRNINTYQVGNTYFMIDASRSMFNAAQSNFPNDAVGVIWTIDGGNNHPQSFNFSATHVTSSNNNWNNKTAVSAHYNAGLAYEYFKNTFGRESINGNGGRIMSLINIAEEDGSSMENAFWNGEAMFYGNGGQAFEPLAKALDVAGHEISHGVIQTTANLQYIGQSGAMNESFADIFGAMIDRNDWKMGEDVVNNQVFPSGALRDLANPNNGGNSLGDPGWQPKDMNEYQNLPNTPQGDNGGVHINSGIVNRAYYLVASNIGKSNAEDIYYRALTQYLTKSSQFTDLRIAVTQSATDIFGAGSNEVAAINSAFNTVGIAGGQGGNYEQDLEINEGEDYVLLSDENLSQVYLINPTTGGNATVLSNTAPISKPSITDDGSAIIFIGADQKMHVIDIDWSAGGAPDEYIIQDEPIWRNVAISKDGNRLAALTNDNDNKMWIYDFILEEWFEFELFNPTFTQGQSTGDVQFADAMEWDNTGEFVLYDASNKISGTSGNDIEYWDASFIKVFDLNNYYFTDPDNVFIEKLFAQLPENTSIGNPTFAKNSPYIVAFDFIDENNNVNLLAANIETGEISASPIYQNSILNYPNYSRLDDRMLFDAQDNNGAQVLAIVDLQGNKIESVANTAAVLVPQGKWGVWFAEGERDLVNIEETINSLPINIFPNPFESTVNMELDIVASGNLDVQVTDLTGKEILRYQVEVAQGKHTETIDLVAMPAGTYILYTRMDSQLSATKIVKLK